MPEGTVHIDQRLTDVSVGYRNGDFIAERVFPMVPVDNQSDKYLVHGKEGFRVRDDRRSPGSEAHLSRWTYSDGTFYCDGHALKDYVPRENQNSGLPQLDLLCDTTEVLTDQILLNQEANLVAALAAGMTPSDQTNIPWDSDDIDPLVVISEAAGAIGLAVGRKPNVLALSEPIWNALRMNANVRGLISGAQSLSAAAVSAAQLAGYLGLEEIIVGSAVYDSASEGQADSLAWVWGKYALLFYRPPSPGRKQISLGYTFAWKAFDSGKAQFVDRYYWQPTKSDVVEVHKYYDQKIIDVNAGKLFSNCIP